ncbi:hypothetical protein BXY66_2325 [Shimia isoporae]|uniref:CTP synthetase n=1 Tax=Shimia isoporae TaxID=647720 RepID=A0A4R1NP42_9RHOB|nr:CTP synthetase [Shimia isoporae]TCL10256.1 hypothetical protein BXY66_2325 [Shimia isoporae]
MFHLTLVLHLFIGATLSGVAIVGVLVAGFSGLWMILGAALAGTVIAFPISRVVARKLYDAG